MLFHTPSFWLFFLAFCAGYILARRSRTARNAVIVAGSYVFYGAWDWRFLGLILFSTALDYAAGLGIATSAGRRGRRAWLWASIVGNLGVLGFFKYWNFFQDNAVRLFNALGLSIAPFTLEVLLPVGISFYTFQTMSYTLDVYAKRIEPTRDVIAFAAYVAFFPQLVAGPIERARSLLPQFLSPRVITTDALVRGADLVIWGLFKKMAVADSLAPFVDAVFSMERAPTLLTALATAAFGVQIYADFSGYSDIARGLARMLGFELTVNFNRPYFANSLREFWHRWHISLSTWLRDYLYIPLGGSDGTLARTARNLAITMVLGGLWHGAAWQFVCWGAWHGLGLAINHALPRWMNRATTLSWVFAGWFLFRVPGMSSAPKFFSGTAFPAWAPEMLLSALAVIVIWLLLERLVPEGGGESPARTVRRPALLSAFLLAIAIACARHDAQAFIYFQF